MKLKIKKKDKVVVISGKEKGKTGEVLDLIVGDRYTPTRVLIAKVNMVTKHKKPTQTDPGGLSKIEAPISISNVMLADPKTGRPTRVKFKTAADGSKSRVAIKSGETVA